MSTLICALSAEQYDLLVKILVIITMCFIPVFIWSLYVSIKVQTTFSKFNKVPSTKKIPAYMVARQILDSEGLSNVRIGKCSGALTDHYDPRTNTVVLSEAVYNSSSIGAIGVAAHEVGHAIQHAKNYLPVKIRGALVPVLNLSSRLLFPAIIINMFLTIFLQPSSPIPMAIFYVILGVYGLNMLFSLVTLPCELNASRRAKDILSDLYILNDEEIGGVSKVLSAAAMTYVASFIMTIIQFARILLIILSNSNRNKK